MPGYVGLIGATLLPHVGGIYGAFITRKAVPEWYNVKVKKPSWRPPNWVFAPVWTCLYTSMGYGSYLVWRHGGGFDGEARLPLMVYGTTLALNWAYTPLFFGKKRMDLALVDISLLWAAIGGCIYTYLPISRTAAYIMIPYWLWVSFATILSYRIWKDNRDRRDE